MINGFSGVAGGAKTTGAGAGAGVGARAEAGTGVAPETPKSIFENSDLLYDSV